MIAAAEQTQELLKDLLQENFLHKELQRQR